MKTGIELVKEFCDKHAIAPENLIDAWEQRFKDAIFILNGGFGLDLIKQERIEQIEKHGRTLERDVKENNHYQLSEAAGLLCAPDPEADFAVELHECCPVDWDEAIWVKMMSKPYKDRLVIAGALIAAEIDRITS
jgi:hypothetical protein